MLVHMPGESGSHLGQCAAAGPPGRPNGARSHFDGLRVAISLFTVSWGRVTACLSGPPTSYRSFESVPGGRERRSAHKARERFLVRLLGQTECIEWFCRKSPIKSPWYDFFC